MAQIRRIRRLSTVSEVVEAFDRVHGQAAFRRFIGRTKQQLSNYKRGNWLPSSLYLAVTEALGKLACEAPPELFRMEAPRASRNAA